MLSQEAKILLFELYKEYKKRRLHGISRIDSKDFVSSESIRDNFCPSLSEDDVVDILCELDRNGYLNNSYASDVVYACQLTDVAIAKLENQPKEAFLSVADFISKFIP